MERRFCPNCGSKSVEPDFSNSAYVGEAGGNPNDWSCEDCGYTGIMPEGNPESSGELKFEPGESYPREDTGFGPAYLRAVLVILGVSAAVALIALLL